MSQQELEVLYHIAMPVEVILKTRDLLRRWFMIALRQGAPPVKAADAESVSLFLFAQVFACLYENVRYM